MLHSPSVLPASTSTHDSIGGVLLLMGLDSGSLEGYAYVGTPSLRHYVNIN